jgi:hypothetical protein
MNARSLVSPMVLALLAPLGCSSAPAPRGAGASQATAVDAPAATIHFAASGEPSIEGALTAGGSVKVDYDYHRLLDAHPECVDRSGFENTPVGAVEMGLKFDDDAGRVHYFDFVSGFSDSDLSHPSTLDTIPLARDVRSLALWFSCGAGARHDVAYDNLGGVNYVFAVAPAATANVFSKTVRTAAGNTFDVTVAIGAQQDGGGKYWSTYTVTIAYDRVQPHGFGGAAASAWVGRTTYVAHHGGGDDPASTTGQMVPLDVVLSGDPAQAMRYTGQVSFDLGGWESDTEENLVGLEFAFHDDATRDAASAWDSNGGANYKLSFPF